MQGATQATIDITLHDNADDWQSTIALYMILEQELGSNVPAGTGVEAGRVASLSKARVCVCLLAVEVLAYSTASLSQ